MNRVFLISRGLRFALWFRKREPRMLRKSATPKGVGGLCEVLTNSLELAVSSATDGRNSSKADNDDQSQHDCVLNCSRAVFRNQELLYTVCELQHLNYPQRKSTCATTRPPVLSKTWRLPNMRNAFNNQAANADCARLTCSKLG